MGLSGRSWGGIRAEKCAWLMRERDSGQGIENVCGGDQTRVRSLEYMHLSIYMCVFVFSYIYIYIYIYREREVCFTSFETDSKEIAHRCRECSKRRVWQVHSKQHVSCFIILNFAGLRGVQFFVTSFF